MFNATLKSIDYNVAMTFILNNARLLGNGGYHGNRIMQDTSET